MKKIFVPLMMLSIFLSGCGKQKGITEFKTETIENVTNDFSTDFEKCKSKEYANLDFTDCSARLPQIKDCYNLELTVQFQPMPTGEIMYQDFEAYCNYFFNEYNSQNALFSSSSDSIEYNKDEDDGKHAWYPKADHYLDQINNGIMEIDSFFYRDVAGEKYLWWNNSTGFPHWVNKGKAYNMVKTDNTKISSWIPSDMERNTARYYNDGQYDDIKIKLSNGDYSVGEAVDYFENEYLGSLPFTYDEKYTLNVSNIDVYNIKDDVNGYVFNFSSAWNSIPFDSREEFFSYEDMSYQYTILGQALMIEKDDIDTVVNLNMPDVKEVGEPIENICSLETAVDILSDKLTHGVKFDLLTIEFIYKGDYNDDYTKVYMKPSWRFIAFNPNDNLYYCAYVDAVSGECSYISYLPIGN